MMNSGSSSSNNVVDLILKYGAAFLAVTYALGFVENVAFGATLGVGSDVRLAYNSYFLRGLVVELLCFGATIINVLWLEFLNHASVVMFDRPTPMGIRASLSLHNRRFRNGLIVGQTVIAFVIPLIAARYVLGLSFRWTVGLAVAASVANMVVSLIMLNPEAFLSSTVRQQLSLLMFVGFGLLVFSVGFGIADGHETFRKSGASVRLLIAPDAIDGLKRLGIGFPDVSTGTATAEPTDSLSVICEGESMYVVRTKDGKILQIKSDKIWSIAR